MMVNVKEFLLAQIQQVAEEQVKAQEFILRAAGAISAYQNAIAKLEEKEKDSAAAVDSAGE